LYATGGGGVETWVLDSGYRVLGSATLSVVMAAPPRFSDSESLPPGTLTWQLLQGQIKYLVKLWPQFSTGFSGLVQLPIVVAVAAGCGLSLFFLFAL